MRPHTPTAAMCPFRVLLLFALICLGRGNGQDNEEEIFTRPGSDLLLPIRLHLTFNHTDGRNCDRFTWLYWRHRGREGEISKHENCNLSEFRYFPNTRISENGSLIISNVTLENVGKYYVQIYNSEGQEILQYIYAVYVEVNAPVVQEEIFTRPGSDLLLPIRHHLNFNRTDTWKCEYFSWNYQESPEQPEKGIAKHRYCKVSEEFRDVPNPRISENGSLIIHNVTLENDGIYSLHLFNHTEDHIQTDLYIVHVEGESRSGMWSGWGQYLFYGAVGVLCTALLICILTNLRKMKNWSEKRKRRDRMEMEPTNCNDKN